jgi:hypothetical protein
VAIILAIVPKKFSEPRSGEIILRAEIWYGVLGDYRPKQGLCFGTRASSRLHFTIWQKPFQTRKSKKKFHKVALMKPF